MSENKNTGSHIDIYKSLPPIEGPESSTVESYTDTSTPNDPEVIPTLSRRRFNQIGWDTAIAATGLSSVLGAAGGTFLGSRSNNSSFNETTRNIISSLNPSDSKEEESSTPSIQLFTNEATENIKRKLKISIKDFVAPDELSSSETEYINHDQLLPIFHPAISHPNPDIGIYRDLIIETANESGINPNMLAFIASFETGGDSEQMGGLFGLTKETFAKFATDTTSEDNIKNPKINAECAAKALSASIKKVQAKVGSKFNSTKDAIHPEVYALAIHDLSHNGFETDLPFNDQSDSSQNKLYTIRAFFHTWNMAFNMRKGDIPKGVKRMDDHEIRANLQSNEFNARMAANLLGRTNLTQSDTFRYLSESDIPSPNEYKIDPSNYDGIVFEEQDKIEELRSIMFYYNLYKEGNRNFEYPLNPWLRRHHATTSELDITQNPINANPNAWSE